MRTTIAYFIIFFQMSVLNLNTVETSEFNNGVLYKYENTLKVLSLSGSHYEMGLQHGHLLSNEIKETANFLNQLISVISINKNIPENILRVYINNGITELVNSIPARFIEEMQGIADGSCIDIKTIYTINLIGDFLAIQGCTGIMVRTPEGIVYHGRTMDIPWGSDWPETVIIKYSPLNYNRFTAVTWPGFVDAETAYNQYFSFSQNAIFVKETNRNGTPFYFLSRVAMEEATTAEEVISLFRTNKTINGEKGFFSFINEDRHFIIDINPIADDNIRLIDMIDNMLWGVNLYTNEEFDIKYQDNIFIKNGNNAGRSEILNNFQSLNSQHSIDSLIEIFRTYITPDGVDLSMNYYFKGVNNPLTTQLVIFSPDNNGIYVATDTTFASSNSIYYYPDDPSITPSLYREAENINSILRIYGESAYKLDTDQNLVSFYKELSESNPEINVFRILYAKQLEEASYLHEAAQIMQICYTQEPKSVELGIDLANILTQLGRFQSALSIINNISPDSISIEKYRSLYQSLSSNLSPVPINNDIIKFRGGLNWTIIYHPPYIPGRLLNGIIPIDNNTFDYTDNGDPLHLHHSINDSGAIIGSTTGMPETSFTAYYEIEIPIIRNTNFLFLTNNLKIAAVFELTPVTIKSGIVATFTPIAFMSFYSGLYIGTGWNIPGLANGMARFNFNNYYDDLPEGILIGDNFYSPLLKWFGGTKLQFDMSSLMDEDSRRWTHLIFTGSIEFTYTSLLRDASNTSNPYLYETTLTFNGWSFQSSFLIGYKIPIIVDSGSENNNESMFLNFKTHNNFDISIFFKTDTFTLISQFNNSTIINKGWGSDFTFVRFGPMIVFDLPNNFYFVVSCEWANQLLRSEDTIGNINPLSYKSIGQALYFDRIILSSGWRF